MPVRTLFQIATRGCIKNLQAIIDVGDMPFEMVRDVLLRIKDPEQLREIEINSPQICGEDSEVWMELIKRNIPNWESVPHQPSNPKNWYKVYRKLHKDNQAAVLKQAEELKAAISGIQTERATHTSKLVEMEALPDSVRKHTALGKGGSRVDTFRSKQPVGPSLNSLTKATKPTSKGPSPSGSAFIQLARRDARENGIFSGPRKMLSTPTHKLNTNATQVASVPKGHSGAGAGGPRPPVVFAPKRTNSATKPPAVSAFSSASESPLSIEERERRLKALKASGTAKPAPASADVKQASPALKASTPVSTPSLAKAGTKRDSSTLDDTTSLATSESAIKRQKQDNSALKPSTPVPTSGSAKAGTKRGSSTMQTSESASKRLKQGSSTNQASTSASTAGSASAGIKQNASTSKDSTPAPTIESTSKGVERHHPTSKAATPVASSASPPSSSSPPPRYDQFGNRHYRAPLLKRSQSRSRSNSISPPDVNGKPSNYGTLPPPVRRAKKPVDPFLRKDTDPKHSRFQRRRLF